MRIVSSPTPAAACAVLLGAAVVAAATPSQVYRRVQAADLTVTVRFTTDTPQAANPAAADIRLEVLRDNGVRQLFSERDLRFASSPNIVNQRNGLGLADLDGDGRLEITLDTSTPGAGCCAATRIVRWNTTTGTYNLVTPIVWGARPARRVDLGGDGRVEFIGTDRRFRGAFGGTAADTAAPLEIWRLDDGVLRNHTALFPGLLRRDAARLWTAFVRAHTAHRREVTPAAAYVATGSRLRDKAAALARVAAVAHDPAMLRRIDATLSRWGYR